MYTHLDSFFFLFKDIFLVLHPKAGFFSLYICVFNFEITHKYNSVFLKLMYL